MEGTININGVEYVKKETLNLLDIADGGWSIVRCDRSGVFMAKVGQEEDTGYTLPQAQLFDARRLWYWEGAASLSELAMRGVAKPDKCKFPCAVPTMIVTDIIEIIPMTEKAVESINGVPEWKFDE